MMSEHRDRLGPDRLRAVLTPTPTKLSAPAPASEPAGRRAAVAAVFTPGESDTELLFIQRATVDGDPWSGQMAFPGGRVEPHDPDSNATAKRETEEEVGLDLSPATHLGRLDDVDGGRGTNRTVTVSAHCYWLEQAARLRPNYEVADALWLPFGQLLDPDRYIDYLYPPAGSHFPGIQLDNPDQVVWGLTLRLLTDLMERLGKPFIQ